MTCTGWSLIITHLCQRFNSGPLLMIDFVCGVWLMAIYLISDKQIEKSIDNVKS